MHFPYIPNFDKRYGGLYGSQTDYASEYCREGFEQLRDQILQGTWKEGEKLPSEQELTETLGVSRSSVRQAIRTLADYGMVETRNGTGTYVKRQISGNYMLNIRAYPLNLQLKILWKCWIFYALLRTVWQPWLSSAAPRRSWRNCKRSISA